MEELIKKLEKELEEAKAYFEEVRTVYDKRELALEELYEAKLRLERALNGEDPYEID